MPRWWAAIDDVEVAALFQFSSANDRVVLARFSAGLRRGAVGDELSRVGRLEPDEEFEFHRLGGTEGHARRTGRYLNWRYRDIPMHDYRLIRTAEAFGVYRIETIMGKDASVIRLLEWTFDAHETGAALATVLADAADRDPILIDFHGTFLAIGSM